MLTALLATLAAGVGAPGARAAGEEIQGPAGDLPEDDKDGSDAAPADDAPPKKDMKAKTGKGDAGSKKKDDDDKEPGQVTWDSYSDLGKSSSVAREITHGVRVEDIVEPPSDYRYAAFGKPDPFVPPLLSEEDEQGPSALEIPLVSPLQRFNLEELSVVGIWQLKSGERKAMVMTPVGGGGGAGAGVIVKNGDLIGKRGGKILGVGEDYLNVREFSLAPDGSRRFEDRQIYMGKRADTDLAGKIRFKPGEKNSEVIIEKDPTKAVQGGEPGAAAADDGFGGAALKAKKGGEPAGAKMDQGLQKGAEQQAMPVGLPPPAAPVEGPKAQFQAGGGAKPQFAPGGGGAQQPKAAPAAGAVAPIK